MPENWRDRVLGGSRIGEAAARRSQAPDPSEEYLLYQTLSGAWPIAPRTPRGLPGKALREAKRNTSWSDPDERWERAVLEFAHRLLDSQEFMATFSPSRETLARAGERSRSPSRSSSSPPGVPDIYQGDELWSLTLVDPDNRRAGRLAGSAAACSPR